MRENANSQSGGKTDLYLEHRTGFNISTMKDKLKMHKKLNTLFLKIYKGQQSCKQASNISYQNENQNLNYKALSLS